MPKSVSPQHRGTKATHPVIVGIGASAGGIQPLERFLERIPSESGMAFVVVQHLDPNSDGLIREILQRATRMPVLEVVDGMRVTGDCVYVVPPDRYLSVLHGVLYLFDSPQPGPLRLPIDFFLRSLAQDQRQHSVAVILSGMGYDGTLGARAVKEAGGLLLVQDPVKATYPSMPRSVVDSFPVDLAGAPEALAATLMNLHRGKGLQEAPFPAGQPLDKVIILLRNRTGHDFSCYKANTLRRRLERRMGIHRIDALETYVRYLQQNPQEIDHLFREILIGVTSFFRDPAGWEVLERVVIPQLAAQLQEGGTLRIWTAGCSTGEEAYSLAISFCEALGVAACLGKKLQIFATDLDPKAIEHARQGLFPAAIAEDVEADRLHRYFVPEGEYYRIKKEIRELVTFAPHNLLSDPPFLRLDLLVCRNLLIYLENEVQKKLLSLFHYAVKPEGFLFLGQSESVGTGHTLFTPVDCTVRIFRSVETGTKMPVALPALGNVPQLSREAAPAAVPNLQTLAEQLLLHQYGPAAILARDNGDILYINGKVGPYLEFASGKANLNLFAMVRNELRPALATGFARSTRESGPLTVSGIVLPREEGRHLVELTVERLTHPECLRDLVLVLFRERSAAPRTAKATGDLQVAVLEHELQQTRETLLVSRRDMRHAQEALQATNEELQAANEELQSANEELQSINEELLTAKEEENLDRVELKRANQEQQARLREMLAALEEFDRLLDAGGPSVYLDRELRVRRYSLGATCLFKLIPGDVGRPLADLSSKLCYEQMIEDAQGVVKSGVAVETLQAAADGRRYAVRILPSVDRYGATDGVVLSFFDVTFLMTAGRERSVNGVREASA